MKIQAIATIFLVLAPFVAARVDDKVTTEHAIENEVETTTTTTTTSNLRNLKAKRDHYWFPWWENDDCEDDDDDDDDEEENDRFGCVDDCPYNNYVDGVCTSPRDIVEMAKQAIFVDFNATAARKLAAPEAIEHNPFLPTGTEPILALLPALEASGLAIEIHRYLQYENLVMTHNTYTNAQAFGGPVMVAFDVYRIENGQIQEHWDNLQPLPPTPNESGNTMTDGPIMVKYRTLTEVNKAIVLEFAERFLIGGDVAAAMQFISSETYIQHNPSIANGRNATLAAFQAAADQGSAIVYDSIELCIAEGNFVMIAGPGHIGSDPFAFYDLFRLDEGLIVEHWDIVQPIPPPEDFVHDNGKF